jgi:hypothetical protein
VSTRRFRYSCLVTESERPKRSAQANSRAETLRIGSNRGSRRAHTSHSYFESGPRDVKKAANMAPRAIARRPALRARAIAVANAPGRSEFRSIVIGRDAQRSIAMEPASPHAPATLTRCQIAPVRCATRTLPHCQPPGPDPWQHSLWRAPESTAQDPRCGTRIDQASR